MNFDFSEEELAFETEVDRFLAENYSTEVMDPNPEQLSQTEIRKKEIILQRRSNGAKPMRPGYAHMNRTTGQALGVRSNAWWRTGPTTAQHA